MRFRHDRIATNRRLYARRGFTSVDIIASIAIFIAAIVLCTQVLVATAGYLKAKRIDFIARQTSENVMEVLSAVPFDQLEQPNENDTDQIDLLMQKLVPPGSSWKVDISVEPSNDLPSDAKRIDVSVSKANRNRAARLSRWRFRPEAPNAKE